MTMNLDDQQRTKVGEWIADGLKLADIQKRLEAEFGLRATYLDVRLLVDDLKLTPKDQEPARTTTVGNVPEAVSSQHTEEGVGETAQARAPVPGPAAGNVSVTVDNVARPGALVSGNVTFSDGNNAAWYLDQYGRLGLSPQVQGYRPAPTDLQTFQTELQRELQKMGF